MVAGLGLNMTDITFRQIRRYAWQLLVLLCVPVLLTGIVCSGCAGADPIPPSETGGTVPLSIGTVPLSIGTVPPEYSTFSTAAPDSTESGYWYLSNHYSSQSFDHSVPRFCPAVLRYDKCAGYRQSSFDALRSGLVPGIPVCIVVHGSFMDLPSTFGEAQQTWHWLRSAGMGRQMQMIYVTWPSDRPPVSLTLALDVNLLGRRAERNGFYLAELIRNIPPECPICLLGHSHGARVISSALHLMCGGSVQGYCHPYARSAGRRIRVVFACAAMDHHWLNPGERYGRAVCNIECLLNLVNRRDPALALYPARLPLLARPSLGMVGLTSCDRRRMGPMGTRTFNIDVGPAIGLSHMWPNFYNDRGLAMLMRNYVYFADSTPGP